MNNDALKGFLALLLILLIQALVVAFIISFFWKLSLQNLFGLPISFFQWFAILFSFNLIRVDMWKIIVDNINKEEKDELRKRYTEDNSQDN